MLINKRIIPVLLLKNEGLYKTCQFSDPTYVGDPINIIRIFNEKEVDELILLDITPETKQNGPNFALLEKLAGECFSPLAYGGGITNSAQAEQILNLGFEKIVLGKSLAENETLVQTLTQNFGSQAIVACVEVKKNLLSKYQVYTNNGRDKLNIDLISYLKRAQDLGVGEIFINDISRDGTLKGYDLNLYKEISQHINVPLIACGGAHSEENLVSVLNSGASAAAAGSLFVFQGIHKAVLISYTNQNKLRKLFEHFA